MKKTILLICSALIAVSSMAQLPKWCVRPDYDNIKIKYDNKVIQTDSAGTSILWNMEGKRLWDTDNDILDYKEGYAVVLRKGTQSIIGFVDTNGAFTNTAEAWVAFNEPYFTDGHIIFNSPKGYGYFNTEGKTEHLSELNRPYPFRQGYAPYFSYANPEKKKDPHYEYYKADGGHVSYIVNDKPVEVKDIQFLSGIAKDGRGIAVIKNKVYWFNASDGTFTPFTYGDDKNVKKRHLQILDTYENYFEFLPAEEIMFVAKYGSNKDTAVLRFDNSLVPVSIEFSDNTITWPSREATEYKYRSPYQVSPAQGGKYTICDEQGREVFPAQFDEVLKTYGNRAIVKKDGKWGIIEVRPDLAINIKLNNNKDIPFRHHEYHTTLQLDLPTEISADNVYVDIANDSKCEIDRVSREAKNTQFGNIVKYECDLIIPDELPTTSTEVEYPVRIVCDGVRLFDSNISTKAWHYVYHNVNINKDEISVKNGTAEFMVNIESDKLVGEMDYHFDVKIGVDSLDVNIEKISETRLRCTVPDLQEGVNNLDIRIIEAGVPESRFPFDITYTKPNPKKREKSETITITRKDTSKKEEPIVLPM